MAYIPCKIGGGSNLTLVTGQCSQSSSADVTVTIGAKPKLIALFTGNTSYAGAFYDESYSTTKYFNSYGGFSPRISEKDIGGQYEILKSITDTGFVLAKTSSSPVPAFNYVVLY